MSLRRKHVDADGVFIGNAKADPRHDQEASSKLMDGTPFARGRNERRTGAVRARATAISRELT